MHANLRSKSASSTWIRLKSRGNRTFQGLAPTINNSPFTERAHTSHLKCSKLTNNILSSSAVSWFQTFATATLKRLVSIQAVAGKISMITSPGLAITRRLAKWPMVIKHAPTSTRWSPRISAQLPSELHGVEIRASAPQAPALTDLLATLATLTSRANSTKIRVLWTAQSARRKCRSKAPYLEA